ncbi:unnamed protein product [Rotaria sp. Silwood1]|nr:unnamed protein product [Rotaria sp. Silwood1]CAF1641783.1 unnamed protein product [Rotaria sp. Silwood1]
MTHVRTLLLGLTCPRYFSTSSFGELETWYEEIDKSSLINVHVIQPIYPIDQISPPPFLLAAYGINSKYTAKDVLDRWSSIFDSCMNQNIRILDFSADCDPKQMKAVRDSMGFEEHPNRFEISLLKVSEQV